MCWKLEKNKDKRPQGYKTKTEKGLSSKDSEKESSGNNSREFILTTKADKMKQFATDDSILKYPNIFIADTGATSDTTPYDIRMQDMIEATAGDAVTDAQGNQISGSKVGNFTGTICDKYGMEVQEAIMKDVVHTPGSGFNLFNISKKLQDG